MCFKQASQSRVKRVVSVCWHPPAGPSRERKNTHNKTKGKPLVLRLHRTKSGRFFRVQCLLPVRPPASLSPPPVTHGSRRSPTEKRSPTSAFFHTTKCLVSSDPLDESNCTPRQQAQQAGSDASGGGRLVSSSASQPGRGGCRRAGRPMVDPTRCASLSYSNHRNYNFIQANRISFPSSLTFLAASAPPVRGYNVARTTVAGSMPCPRSPRLVSTHDYFPMTNKTAVSTAAGLFPPQQQ